MENTENTKNEDKFPELEQKFMSGAATNKPAEGNEIHYQHSNVKRAKFIPESSTLEVDFSNNSIYQYAQVPEDIWKKFRAADKPGSFIHSDIKNKFTCTKIK